MIVNSDLFDEGYIVNLGPLIQKFYLPFKLSLKDFFRNFEVSIEGSLLCRIILFKILYDSGEYTTVSRRLTERCSPLPKRNDHFRWMRA